MAVGDLLDEAVAELYSADPEEFVQRRSEWAARARAAGQAATVRKINALRKPTRSAWVVNRLARAEPDAAGELAALGEKLRAAERARDGGRLRELSRARRELIARLIRQALAAADQHAPPAAMREEITETFAAALADPDVAEQVRQGMLVRPARRPGFGMLAEPMLTLVPPLGGADTARPAGGTQTARPAGGTGAAGGSRMRGRAAAQAEPAARSRAEAEAAAQAQTAAQAQAQAAARAEAQARARARAEAEAAAAQAAARAEAERERIRAEAERALAAAQAALEEAGQVKQAREDTVRRLEEELNEARRLLHEARAQVWQAEAGYRKARQALARLPG